MEQGAAYRGALGVMCSCEPQHNPARIMSASLTEKLVVDNAWAAFPAASKEMQTSLLRDAWGFEYVVGDSDTVKFIDTEHHYVDSPAGTVRAALSRHRPGELDRW